MRGRIRAHLTYANVMATLAVFIALGGTALAAVIITDNSQVAPDTISGHKPPTGDQSNIISASVTGEDVANNRLTGADIKDRSNVDTCQTPLLGQFGPICAGSDAGARSWNDALNYCAGLGLRLPSNSEAVALAVNYDVPGVSGTQYFWTDVRYYDGVQFRAAMVDEGGGVGDFHASDLHQTVCVTDPSA